MLTIYLLNEQGILIGREDRDPLERMPERFTLTAPPDLENGQYAHWSGSVWSVLDEVPAPNLDLLKAAKNEEINSWRAAANLSTFPHAGKLIACDTLSRSDIDGVANHIALFGAFPDGFPGAWKATDNTFIPLADIQAFRAMYASMTTQGTRNFVRAQELKSALAAARTVEQIAAIIW
ncbi:hypothetical protein B0920_02020 [Massilia sp. KIM]|uniref:DUF4376 domain-containing protein n=1 Tax=Massilia sp. KIM TaxID=1955422 RepID=UPI00098E8B31|nr:DUF4376 domain-containing protein [Massilia sp. KIM]OON62277.1 hypothetical protein B0920_02020 [Massilia sp. KIM]